MTRFIDGGRDRVIELVQLAVLNNDPCALAWWQVYAELPAYQRAHVVFDDVCAASGVTAKAFCVMLVSTSMEFAADSGNLVASMTHPQVLAKLAESALRIDGEHAEIALRDRHAFLQGQKFLPVPKGAVQVNVSASAQAAAAAGEPTMPKFSDSVGGVRTAVQSALPSRAALPAASPDLDPFDQMIGEAVDAELVPVPAELDGR